MLTSIISRASGLLLALALIGTSAACSFAPESTDSSEFDQYALAREQHRDGEEGARAKKLFASAMRDDSEGNVALADRQRAKVHVKRLHRATLYEYPVGRRESSTNSDGQLVEVLDETPRLVGWVAELGSIRSGTIEYVFYNNDWSEIASLTPDGFLTVGYGRSQRKLEHRLDVSKAAHVVFRAKNRYSLRSYEEDIAMIGIIANDPNFADKMGVRNSEPTTMIAKYPKRVVLRGADPKRFRTLLTK